MRLAKLHQRLTNQRDDFLHKLSLFYVDNYDLIAIEDLNIKGMAKNHWLAQSILDIPISASSIVEVGSPLR